jgi:general stress protein 26
MDKHSSVAADLDKVWAMMKKIGFCMLITGEKSDISSRPMSAIVRKDHNDIIMFTEKQSGKDSQINQNSNVVLNFSDGSNEFLSLKGVADISEDRDLIKKHWNPGAQAYFPNGPDDPDVVAIIVEPRDAEYWITNSGLISSVKMAFAIATGQQPDLGENKKLAL